jgi:ubiquinone/menaquinone biosynthesis C-methylase UbiE/DNA-binding transcriptional ArsR family regulator
MESSKDRIRRMVRERYAKVVQSTECTSSGNCCAGFLNIVDILNLSKKLGYTDDQIALGLGEANFARGCGNPISMADLKPGETVLDLGSGTGFDALLAANSVGPKGQTIGVDMTSEMVVKAGKNAEKFSATNVEFKLGEIEKLPVPDNSVDVVLSNCAINLSPDKRAVCEEIFRVLKPGGRVSISDVLSSQEIPKEIKDNPKAYTACISGAISADEVRQILVGLGFESVSITKKSNSEEIIKSWNMGTGIENIVFTAYIKARKPILEGSMFKRSSEDLKVLGKVSLEASKKRLAELSKGLAHPARVEIIHMLANKSAGARCICGEIVNALPLAQSSVSQHLKVLRETGWIQSEVRGVCVYYWIVEGIIEYYLDLMKRSLEDGEPQSIH